nr:type I polyketide synthase 8 [Streptomyces sp.]
MSDQDAIAIVGLSCRFPGARDTTRYWANLRAGTDSISRFGTDELRAAGVAPDLARRPDYVPARGVLGAGDRFDWVFFGYSRAEAARIDPQQRVFLECAATALDDAGIDPRRFAGWIGAFAGCDAAPPPQDDGGDVLGRLLGREKDYLATRVAYKLGLRGPAITVQSACSTSLVAVHTACRSLLAYECDAALAGGVALWLPQTRGYLYQEGHILSRDGRCRPFDADATGTVTSSGAGVVVLKRLADALRDGDRVVAVIRGSAVNNDGSEKIGFTTPAFAGQRDVILLAMAQADVEPRDIRHVEAHGTGTRVGDPIEVAALAAAFEGGGEPAERSWLGSVKSNLGHTGAASGVAGLIKTALMLHHRELVPTLHYRDANPEMRLSQTPFRICAERRALPAEGPLLASVSSFGMGGTNAHAVLEAPPQEDRPAPRSMPRVFALSAATPAALAELRERTAQLLTEETAPRLDDMARTLAAGRRLHPHRLALQATEPGHLAAALRGDATASQARGGGRVAFLFPGQGSLRPGVGRAAHELLPRFREVFEEAADLAGRRFGVELNTLLDPDADARWTTDTEHQQLGLFVLGYALAQQFQAWGMTPDAMLGHSLGEYVAATCAGVWQLPDALALIRERGRAMRATAPGRMLALPLPRDEVAALLRAEPSLSWAVDTTDHAVLSGEAERIEALHESLRERGIDGRLLATERAFHSPLMEPAVEPLRQAVAAIDAQAPGHRYVSNLTGDWMRAERVGDPDYWADQLRGTVRLTEGYGTLLADGCDVFVELGPGASLSRGLRRHARWDPALLSLPLLGHSPEQERGTLLQALGELWQRGLPVPLDELATEPAARACALPAHPLEPRECEDAAPKAAQRQRAVAPRAETGPVFERWVQQPAAEAGRHDLVIVLGEPGPWHRGPFLRALHTAEATVLPGPAQAPIPCDVTALDAVLRRLPEQAGADPLVVVECARPADEAFVDRLDALADRAAAAGARLAVLARNVSRFPGATGAGPLTAWVEHRQRGGGAGSVCVLDPGPGEFPELPPVTSADSALYAWRHGQWWSHGACALPDGTASTPVSEQPVLALLGADPAAATLAADLAADGLAIGAFATVGAGPTADGRVLAGELAGTLDWQGATARLSQRPELNAYLNAYCAGLIARFVHGAARLTAGSEIDGDGLRRRIDPENRLPGVVDFFLRTLVAEEWLSARADGFVVTEQLAPRLAAALERGGELSEVPGLRLMLDEVAEALPEVFAGRREPVSVLWPGGDETLLRKRLRDNQLAVYDAESCLNAMVAAVRSVCAHRRGPVRVLEVGGGHGGFTWRLLEQWADRGKVDYHFTDVSPLLVRKAAARAGELGLSGLRFSPFDITQDPVGQGLAPGTFDLVVAYNVVHVAPQVRPALDRLGRLLRYDGLLCMVELTRIPLWHDLLNSLAPGWWDFDDDLRRESIHLDTGSWRRALSETGFAEPVVLPAAADTDHSLILAGLRGPSPSYDEDPADPGAPAAAELLRQLPDAAPDAAVFLANSATPQATAELWERLQAAKQLRPAWVVSQDPDPADTWQATGARRRLDPPDGAAHRWRHLRVPRLDAEHLSWLPSLAGRPGLPAIVRVSGGTGSRAADLAEAVGTVGTGKSGEPTNTAGPRHPDSTAGSLTRPDGTEAALAQLWCEVLGLPRATQDDNFFTLGGESLMAVYFLSQLRERLGLRLSMSSFVAAPTFGQLLSSVRLLRPEPSATATAAPTGERTATATPPTLLAFRTTGSRAPVFFVAPAAGSSLCYRELAHLLGEDQPFYGVDSPGLYDGSRPPRSFEELAARHLAAIRQVRPHGPYVLGGWSVGAMVAHEMVRQLHRLGEEVQLLVCVDGVLPNTNGRPVGTVPAHLTRNLWYHLQASLGSRRGTGLGKTIALTASAAAGQADGAPDFVRVHNAGIRAMLKYRPRPVPCPAVLLKTGLTPPQLAVLRERLAPLYPVGLRVRPVGGDHWTVLDREHVHRLAEAVDEELTRTAPLNQPAGTQVADTC